MGAGLVFLRQRLIRGWLLEVMLDFLKSLPSALCAEVLLSARASPWDCPCAVGSRCLNDGYQVEL